MNRGILSAIGLLFVLVWGPDESCFAQLSVSNWNYILVDSTKAKWGDFAEPEWLRYFGLDFGDVNSDGYQDIITGRNIFLNPGGTMTSTWEKIDIGRNADAILFMDVDGDEYADFIAQALPDLLWFEALDKGAITWKVIKIGTIPATSHVNSQGFKKADIIRGGKSEFIIAGEKDIYCLEIPSDPLSEKWKITLIAENTSDEGIGVGDIDNDGDVDVAAGRRPAGGDEPLIVVWFENPGNGTGNWKDREIATISHPADRFEVADLDGDSRADIIVCEERYPGLEPDGNIFWFEQPAVRTDQWIKNRVVTQYSSNNLSVVDMDLDGDIDILTAEHKGPDPELQLWVNDGTGNFTKKVLDHGKENHLGARVQDLDRDGDLDIVSIGWDKYNYVHLWRNDDINQSTRKWRLISSADGQIGVPNSGNQQTSSLVVDIDKDGDMDFFISERTQAPSLTMFRYAKGSWERYIVDAGKLRIEAGAATYDIDNDGDMDIVFGGESQSNEVWWWENPYPKFDPNKPWNRYTIKKSGATKHHDQMFGDVTGDGVPELIFWNQGDNCLIKADIPNNPKAVREWPMTKIYIYNTDSEMEPAVGMNGYPGWQSVNEHEGLVITDMDGDGINDIVGGGRWFKYKDNKFIENIIDASFTFSRSAVGQFIKGGRPEVILMVGDGLGPLNLYEWHEWSGNKQGTGTWAKTTLFNDVDNGHTLDVVDFNGDGNDDIFMAEMRFGDGNPDAKVRILLGDGAGHFTEMIIAEGYGVHEGKIADLDGDGDLDILGKPYTWHAPLLNIWLNDGPVEH